jgi:hypothetical protein
MSGVDRRTRATQTENDQNPRDGLGAHANVTPRGGVRRGRARCCPQGRPAHGRRARQPGRRTASASCRRPTARWSSAREIVDRMGLRSRRPPRRAPRSASSNKSKGVMSGGSHGEASRAHSRGWRWVIGLGWAARFLGAGLDVAAWDPGGRRMGHAPYAASVRRGAEAAVKQARRSRINRRADQQGRGRLRKQAAGRSIAGTRSPPRRFPCRASRARAEVLA